MGILFIIPLIIVSVVTAVSVVVSTFNYIGIESVTLDKNVIELAFGKEYYQLSDYLSVEVLPERATNPTCSWSIENLICWDDDYRTAYENYVNGTSLDEVLPPATLVDESGSPVDSNSDGKIMINSYCSFVLVAQAETMSARCNVIVSGAELADVTLTQIEKLTVGDGKRLEYVLDPIDAIVKDVEWLSLDSTVATVDKNGIVNGVGKGSTEIVVKAHTAEGNVVEDSIVVEVEEGVSTFGSTVYTCENTLSLSSIGVRAEDILSATNCSLSGEVATLLEAEGQITTAKGTLRVVKCNADDFVIAERPFFDNENEYILTAGHSVNLSVKGLCSLHSFDDEEVLWSVDDESVATITEDGVLTGVSDGLVTVVATIGDSTAMITVNVHKKVTTLVVDRTAEELGEVGIAREYVMGAWKYDTVDGVLTKTANSFDINVVRPVVPESPEEKESFYNMFTFIVKEGDVVTDKAYVEGNRLIFVPEKISGKTELTVVIKAVNPMYASLAYLTTAEIKVKVTDAVSVGSFKELDYALERWESVCLTDNVKYLDGADDVCGTMLEVFGDYYGNGYMLSAQRGQISKWQSLIDFKSSNTVISNAIFRCNEFPGDTITSEGENALYGTPVVFSGIGGWDGRGDESLRLTNILMEYCIIENGANALVFYGSDVHLNGCILRNTSGAAVVVKTEWTDQGINYSNLTIENCVMSNMLGLGFSFQYVDYDKQGVDQALQYMAEGRNTHFYQKGFLDMYNWQPANTMGLIPTGLLGEGMESLEAGLNSMLRDEFAKDALAPYRYAYDNIDYFLLGGMSTGLLNKSYLEGTLSDPRLIYFDSSILDNLLISAFNEQPVHIFTYRNDVTDVTPGRKYVINKKLIDKLHGVGVEYGEDRPFSFA